MSPNHPPVRADSPVLPTPTNNLSDHHRKLSAISEATAQTPRFPTFLDSPSPPTSPNYDSPTLPSTQTFLYSPSLSRPHASYSPMLAAFPLPPTQNSISNSTFSDFSGEYPTPPLSYSNSSNNLPSWTSGHSTASSTPFSQYRSHRLSDILPDNMDLYDDGVEEYMLEPVKHGKVVKVSRNMPVQMKYTAQRRSDIVPDGLSPYAGEDGNEVVRRVNDVTGREGLGLELPVIGEKDFEYYPKTGEVDQGVQIDLVGREDAGKGKEGERRKSGIRFSVRNWVRKVCMKIGVGRYV
ncbi:hypothetical protein NX059_008636 [Plenodomus lindquistii]|nr:hypothetical protein NX059_008636 [Plenodomus lindquistii]